MIKFGIIGTNFISDWMADAALKVEDIELTAVFSRKEQTGRAFAQKHGIGTVYTDLSQMLSSDIVAVYVASPTFKHYEHSLCALNAGKHVLCEKMLTVRLSEAEHLASVAREKGLVLMEAMRPLHDPAIYIIKEALPKLGRIRRVHFEYCQYSSRYDAFKQGRVLNAFDPTIGNSALADIGIYPLAMTLSLFGEPKRVSTMSTFLENGFECMGEIAMDYGDMRATVSYSKINEGVRRSVIEGEDASISVSKLSAVSDIDLVYRDGTVQSLKSDVIEGTNMDCELRDFCDAIKGVKGHNGWLDTALLQLKIAEISYSQNGTADKFDYSDK